MRLIKTVQKASALGCELPLLPLWGPKDGARQAARPRAVSPKATDEGCSRERRRLTPLEHPSSVSALTRRSTFPHKGGRKGRVAALAERKQST